METHKRSAKTSKPKAQKRTQAVSSPEATGDDPGALTLSVPWTSEPVTVTRIEVFPKEVLHNKKAFIETVRVGISGQALKEVVATTGLRDVWGTILQVDKSNLSKQYRKKRLDSETTEDVLDTVRLLNKATEVWESKDMADVWLKSTVPALGNQPPLALFDTSEGRRWVSQVLDNIEHGEFS